MLIKMISDTRDGIRSVYNWRPADKKFGVWPEVNVGDRLALDLTGRIIAERKMGFRHYAGGSRRLFSIGSVLHFARTGDVIWGSGINGKVAQRWDPALRLDLRAVRGPLTARALTELGMAVPAVYGDPGILTDRYFPLRSTRELPYWVVPHFREAPDLYAGQPLLSPRQMPAKFLRKLVRAQVVVSSSLHGLVLAEAYGIPAVPLKNHSGENEFKYRDYYEGTGREFPGFSDSVADALRREPPPGIPAGVKDRLLAVYPWDLWAKGSAR